MDFNNTEQALGEIASFLHTTIYPKPKGSKLPSNNDSGMAVGVIGIALGLLALWGLSRE